MRKKANSIIFAILTTGIVALPHAPKILSEGPLLTATAVAVVVSVPPKCEASIAYGAYASAVILFRPPVCEASVMEQLCSSVTSFLNDEAVKAGAALKSCKTNCRWKKRKDDLITTAKKKAKDSCAKGEAPDINGINKGLDTDAKTRLKNLYNQNSRMFDGKAKLPNKDFEPVSSKQAATLTGKGGLVTDLKSAEPATPKLNTASEFSLSGTKLSGGTPDLTTPKQSTVLLAAPATAKTSADSTSVLSAKSSAPGAAAAASAAAGKAAIASAAGIDPGFAGCFCIGTTGFIPASPTVPNQAACPGACCDKYGVLCPPGRCGPGYVLNAEKKCVTACGGKPYDTTEICCTNDVQSKNKFSDKKTTLDSCPYRIQKTSDKNSIPNGCGVPWYVWPILKFGYGAVTPDNPVSTSPATSFRTYACNDHDICYGTCNNNKNDEIYRTTVCDQAFSDNIGSVCRKLSDPKLKNKCEKLQIQYVGQVKQRGEKNYIASQKKWCKCCPVGSK